MLNTRRGFSLVELMVTLVVLAVLLTASLPAIGTWIANARVRSVAEEIQNGLRLAQTEAVRRSRQTVFALTNATPALAATPAINGSNWFVRALPVVASEAADATFLATAFATGGSLARQGSVTITGPALICFNTLGRQVSNSSTGLGADCVAGLIEYDVTRSGSDRAMRVQANLGGRIRMCDPAKSIATQPDGC